MPLQAGSSQTTIKGNVAEMLHKFKKKGMIGKIKPENMLKARKIALAAAFNKADE